MTPVLFDSFPEAVTYSKDRQFVLDKLTARVFAVRDANDHIVGIIHDGTPNKTMVILYGEIKSD